MKRVSHKEHMTVDVLTRMYNTVNCERNLYNQRSRCACLINYSAVVLGIKRLDIVIDCTHMSIFIEHSQTEIDRDGTCVLIS